MKNNNITEQEFNKFEKLYPQFSREQLEQIILADKEGLNFTSFTDPSLSSEEMKKKREDLSDLSKKYLAEFECKAFSASPSSLFSFYNPNEYLLKHLIDESVEGVTYKDITRWASQNGFLRGKLDKLVESFCAGKQIINGTKLEEKVLPEKYQKLAQNIRLKQIQTSLMIYPGFEGTADIYKTFGKNEHDFSENVCLNQDSAFSFRNKLRGYNENYFSYAILTKDLKMSLSVLPNNTATKSEARVELVFCDNDSIYIDSAHKYFDISLLVAGLKS